MLSFEMLDKRLLLSASDSTTTMTASDIGSGTMQAAAQTTITSVRDGLWSNPATWNAGRVPGPTDDVVVANNITIDQASAHKLEINTGTTTLAGSLQAYGPVIVRSNLVGTQGGIYFHVADDRLATGNAKPGPDSTMPDFHPEDIGLWALPGSHVDLQGEQVSSWVNALGSGAAQDLGHGVSQRVAFGSGTATLQTAPVGWRAGDTLLLVNEHGQSLLADLVSVSGTSIQYQERKVRPADPNLVGHELVTQGSGLVVYPKIADLTRRVQIVGADVREGDTNHRAFTVAMQGAAASFANVEFRDLGPRGKLGRYPVYLQDANGAASKLTGSSVWQDVTDPGNRFVALAGVQGATVSSNVAYRSRGDGFFMEDGSETGNTIAGNLSVAVVGGEELSNAYHSVTELTHHYWLRTGNTISGNVAAGGDAIGMIILASAHPTTAAVTGTEVLGAGLFGMWTGTPNVTFVNPVAVYNTRAGFASEPAWDVDSHGATLKNPLFLFNGTSDSSYGSQIYSNNGDRTLVDGGVLAGKKALHTHYHSSITVSNATIDVETLLVPTYWEQAAIFSQDKIRAELLFERAYPSPRYASPGLARIVNSQLQVGDEPVEQETADYIGDAFQNYPALSGEPIPNGIELLQPAPDSGFIRVTMLSDEDRWMTNIARWTVTPIGQTPTATSFIYHRQTAWSKLAAYGGYPDGFPPGEYAVKLYTDTGTLLKSGFAVVRPGQVSDLTDTLDAPAQVVGRKLFYNQSKFDGNAPGINSRDDGAIAIDKSAYLPGSATSTFANVSSYVQGLNGIMVDIAGSHGSITASDFIFKMGNNNTPGAWASASSPSTISVRAGAGSNGADRVEIIWNNGAIKNTWLQVIVRGNDAMGGSNTNTGLASSDVFYFGSAVGDSGKGDASGYLVDIIDEVAARNDPHGVGNPAAVSNPHDFNRDGLVNSTDQILARRNVTNIDNELKFLAIGSGALAPEAAPAPTTESIDGNQGLASSLAISTSSVFASKPGKILVEPARGQMGSSIQGRAVEALFSQRTADDAGADMDLAAEESRDDLDELLVRCAGHELFDG
jgi:hypothetical protein